MTESELEELKRCFQNNTEDTKVYYVSHYHRAKPITYISSEGTIWFDDKSSLSYKHVLFETFALVTKLA